MRVFGRYGVEWSDPFRAIFKVIVQITFLIVQKKSGVVGD